MKKLDFVSYPRIPDLLNETVFGFSCIHTRYKLVCQFLLPAETSIIFGRKQKHLKRQTKIAADDTLIYYFYLSKKIRLEFSCESSA